MADSKFNMKAVLDNLEKVKAELPVILGNQAQKYFVGSWQKQGFDGKPWQEVKRREAGTPEYKYPMKKGLSRRTKPILLQTGRLRRAVNASVRSASFEKTVLIVDVPYAKYINDGTDKMVARPFMKDSPILQEKQIKKIHQYIDKIWQV